MPIVEMRGKKQGGFMAISKNDITGDRIQTKGTYSKEAANTFDNIFRKPKFTDSDRYQLIRKAVLNQRVGLAIDGLNLALPKSELEFDQCIDSLLELMGK